MKGIFALTFAIVLPLYTNAQQHNDVIEKEYTLENEPGKMVVYVANINGQINVTPSSAGNLSVEGRRWLRADSQEELEKAKNEFGIAFNERHDTVFVYLSGICGSGNFTTPSYNGNNRWNYRTDKCKQDFDFKMDLAIRLPSDVNIYLATVNDGDISVRGMEGSLDVHHVNGSITIDGARGSTIARTINGDLTMNYVDIPPSASYYSLNGDIEATYPPGFSANVTFKSYNGEFYTNIDDYTFEPIILKETVAGKGVAFKAETSSVIRFRAGNNRALKFETFNGDTYVKEN